MMTNHHVIDNADGEGYDVVIPPQRTATTRRFGRRADAALAAAILDMLPDNGYASRRVPGYHRTKGPIVEWRVIIDNGDDVFDRLFRQGELDDDAFVAHLKNMIDAWTNAAPERAEYRRANRETVVTQLAAAARACACYRPGALLCDDCGDR